MLGSIARTCSLLAALLGCADFSFARDSILVGPASVIDGASIEVHGTRARLFGIDAPERDQLCRDDHGKHYRCGQRASNDLAEFIANRPVECTEILPIPDILGRKLVVCKVGGVDLADWAVRNGVALSVPREGSSYAAAQAEAKEAQRGVWAGTFKEPWKYRACTRSGLAQSKCSDD